MEALDDLLTGPLEVYLEAFYNAGYDDFNFLMEMQKIDWEEMLDVVQEELDATGEGITLKRGHRIQIMSKLRREQAVRQTEEKKEQNVFVPVEQTAQEIQKTEHFHKQQHVQRKELSMNRALFVEGLNCMSFHWSCCFASSVLCLVISLILLLLYTSIGVDAPTADGAGLNEKNGSWDFLKTVYILGFVFAGLTMFACMVIWCLFPTRRPLSQITRRNRHRHNRDLEAGGAMAAAGGCACLGLAIDRCVGGQLCPSCEVNFNFAETCPGAGGSDSCQDLCPGLFGPPRQQY